MKAVILGCGRVGSMLATLLAEQKWEVTVVDSNPDAFISLGETFAGNQVSGQIADEETLKLAGLDSADIIVILTSDDIINLMAAQIAHHKFGKAKILVRVRDPIKAGAYRDLGLEAICPSEIELDMIRSKLGLKSKK